MGRCYMTLDQTSSRIIFCRCLALKNSNYFRGAPLVTANDGHLFDALNCLFPHSVSCPFFLTLPITFAMIDTDNLRTASLYINNQLLSRGLLKDGQNIDFTNPGRGGDDLAPTMARIMSIVNDLILRRDVSCCLLAKKNKIKEHTY